MTVDPTSENIAVLLSREEAEKLLRLNSLVLAEVKTKLTAALATREPLPERTAPACNCRELVILDPRLHFAACATRQGK